MESVEEEANLTKGMRMLVVPCVVGLVAPSSNLSISGSIHGTLINVGRPTDDVLIVHYNALGMHIYHEPPILLH